MSDEAQPNLSLKTMPKHPCAMIFPLLVALLSVKYHYNPRPLPDA